MEAALTDTPVTARSLATQLGLPKRVVNKQLYDLYRIGRAHKDDVSQPPRWSRAPRRFDIDAAMAAASRVPAPFASFRDFFEDARTIAYFTVIVRAFVANPDAHDTLVCVIRVTSTEVIVGGAPPVPTLIGDLATDGVADDLPQALIDAYGDSARLSVKYDATRRCYLVQYARTDT